MWSRKDTEVRNRSVFELNKSIFDHSVIVKFQINRTVFSPNNMGHIDRFLLVDCSLLDMAPVCLRFVSKKGERKGAGVGLNVRLQC